MLTIVNGPLVHVLLLVVLQFKHVHRLRVAGAGEEQRVRTERHRVDPRTPATIQITMPFIGLNKSTRN